MIMLWELYADGLSATRNPMATGSGSQCHVSFREMLLMCLEILPSSHARIPGRNIFITYFPIRVPEVGPLQGSGFGGATEYNTEKELSHMEDASKGAYPSIYN